MVQSQAIRAWTRQAPGSGEKRSIRLQTSLLVCHDGSLQKSRRGKPGGKFFIYLPGQWTQLASGGIWSLSDARSRGLARWK
jgi:hypothetical protein